jgi:wyosine [tRNA(Phe)-imidazoG37] synthetase (radical SAM superfamily)
MADKRKYLYGPVPSRRLGRSLGVDIVPFKVCTQDCIYCQLGKTPTKTIERKDYAPVQSVLAELREALAEGVEADFISIAGSGEPTLHARLGELIDGIREITSTAVAILTNGTLLYQPDVRADCAKADVVLPSLDAADEQTFGRINRPYPGINAEKVISGLCTFRKEFSGRIWLEVFFIKGINTAPEQIAAIRDAIERIQPDKVQLNTAVRPTAEANVKRLSAERLRDIAAQLGPRCEVVADFSPGRHEAPIESRAEAAPEPAAPTKNTTAQALLSMLKRRPCSLDDISASLGISRNEAMTHIRTLQRRELILPVEKGGRTFFKAVT